MGEQSGAVEFLRELAAGLEVYLPAGEVDVGPDIERLRDVADDLETLLGSPLPPPWDSKGRSAEARLRKGCN